MRSLLWLAAAVLLSLLWRATAQADPSRLRAKVTAESTPTVLCPGEARTVPVTLTNSGAEPWDPASKDRFSYHWRDASGAVAVYDGERTLLPERVEVDGWVRLDARLLAPPTPGHYTLQWKMVREGARWIPTDDGEIAVQIVDTDRPAMALAVSTPAPISNVAAGDTFAVAVVVDNVGCVGWSPDAHDNLAYHWLDESGAVVEFEGRRTPLPATAPGASATVTATVAAPDRAGTFSLQWAIVREGMAWIELDPTAAPAVEVADPQLGWSWSPIDAVPLLAVGQVATVRLSLTNTGTQAWRHDDGDRLSYRWLDAEGAALPDEGMRSSLPPIVAPGETITVDARLRAPERSGTLALAWEPVREHVRWFGPPMGGARSTAVEVSPRRYLAWALRAVEEPGAVFVRRERSLQVTITNVGAEPWSESTADHLSYRWLSPDGEVIDEGLRTPLPDDIASGETVTLSMRVQGPAEPGRHTLEIMMVREHVAWFGPPHSDIEHRLSVAVSRVAIGVSLAFAFLTAGFVALRRKHLAAHPSRVWIADRVALPLWAAVAVGLAAEVFVDLGGVPQWEGGAAVGWSCAAIIGLGVALLPSRVQAWAGALVATLATALVLADLAYLDFFGSIVPLTALAALHHLGDAHGTVASLLSTEHAWLLALPCTGLLLALTLGPSASAPRLAVRRRARLVVALLCLLGATHAVRRIADSVRGSLGVRVFSQHDNVGRFGLFGAHVFELARNLVDALVAAEPPTGEARQALEAFFAQRAAQRSARTKVTGSAAGYNVIVLQVEAMSSWARGLVVDGQPVTPFLDRAPADAWLSMSIYDQTAQGRTSDAEFLVLSSGHPLEEGALSFRHDANRFETLAHTLQQQGYATLSAHPYSRGFWNRAVLHPRYGFGRSMFRRELGPGPVVGWGLSDAAFLERMVDPIAELPSPWFAFLITLSLHHPYEDFPDPMRELKLSGALADSPVGNYLQAMRHFDSAFATFMGELAARGLADNTIVVVYGDHVTGMESRSAVWELAGFDAWSPDLPMRIRQVPLLIWAPGVAPKLRDEGEPRGQIDVGPTVLDLLGVDAPPAYVGVSLAARDRPHTVVLPNGSAVAVDRLYVASGRDVPREGACFDLPSGTTRPRADCDALAAAAAAELRLSRAVVEHDLHRAVGAPSP